MSLNKLVEKESQKVIDLISAARQRAQLTRCVGIKEYHLQGFVEILTSRIDDEFLRSKVNKKVMERLIENGMYSIINT